MKYQYLDTAVINKCKWDSIKSLVHMSNFKESFWYSKLSKADLKKLEKCIQIQQEIDEQDK